MPLSYVVGNWKQNGSLAANRQLLADLVAGSAARAGAELAVAVPYPYLAQVQAALQGSHVGYGAQDVSAEADGAFTGEVGARMLREFAVRYVLVGHSERRTLFAESDVQVAAKARRAVAEGLLPVLCVGETLAERNAGVTMEVVGRQLRAVLAAGVDVASIIVAYEPVWAIGTGRTATAEQAEAVHAFIRSVAAEHGAAAAQDLAILYGGSVKPDNAKELFAMPNVNGGLIGGASLKAADFLSIWNALP